MKNQPRPARLKALRADARPSSAARAAVVEPAVGQDMVLSYRWVWYLLSLFVPFAGLLIALFLYDQDSREIRKVGRNCLLIAFLVWVVLPLLVFLALLLVSVLALADWFTNIVSPTD
ncbi:MAG TPA: hypothetical protein VK859_02825 [bacterium]|jgi:hypothetical protein|nr:hypothetical protein [bacterium]